MMPDFTVTRERMSTFSKKQTPIAKQKDNIPMNLLSVAKKGGG
jgi:hypothetical protein